MNSQIISNFLDNHKNNKFEKEHKTLSVSGFFISKKILENYFMDDENMKMIQGGRGYGRRRKIMLKNLIVNHLLNCLRTREGLDTVPFKIEFRSKLKEYDFDSDSDDELSPEQLEKLNELLQDLDIAKMEENDDDINEINEEIKNIKNSSPGKKPEPVIQPKHEQQSNICQNCENELIEEKGMLYCLYCGLEAGPVYKQGYIQSGNIAGAAVVGGRIGMIVDKLSEDVFKQRTLKLIGMYDDCMAVAEDRQLLFMSEHDESMKEAIWHMMKVNREKSFDDCKIELIRMVLNKLKRIKNKHLKKNINYLAGCFNVKTNLSYLLDPAEERQHLEIRLLNLMNEDEQEYYKTIKIKAMRNKNFKNLKNNSAEQYAAIANFVLYTKRNGSKMGINEMIQECGIAFSKYSNHYKILKRIKF